MNDEKASNPPKEEEEPSSRKRKADEIEEPTTTEDTTELRTAPEAIASVVDCPRESNTINPTETKNAEPEIATQAVQDVEEQQVPQKEETVDPSIPTDETTDPARPTATNSTPTPAITPSIIPTTPKSSYENLKYTVVRNDGQDASMIKLIGLKSLFSKQLPKMPRAYIARLVLDRRHTSLAILHDSPSLKDTDDEIVGGICYRAFPEMRFAEIAFCAVHAQQQVKGYGSKLMNLFKNQAIKEGIEYLITYADNYAIGYFKKQGFSKTISMPKGRYFGLIKEYDGGTPMECYVHPSVDYTRIPEMLQAQKDFILQRLRLTANSHIVYEPLPPNFAAHVDSLLSGGALATAPSSTPTSTSGSRGNTTASRALHIPGILQAGWTWNDLREANRTESAREQQKSLKTDLLQMIHRIKEQQFAWPFLEPVDTKEVPDYLDVITEPVDLATMEKRIRTDNYYRTRENFFKDIQTMVENCKNYNEDGSMYVGCAKKLEKFMNDKLKS